MPPGAIYRDRSENFLWNQNELLAVLLNTELRLMKKPAKVVIRINDLQGYDPVPPHDAVVSVQRLTMSLPVAHDRLLSTSRCSRAPVFRARSILDLMTLAERPVCC